MHRRGFLMGALGASAAAATATANAGIVCKPLIAQNLRRCNVGLRVPFRTARQRCPNWCWAACVETVFALSGHAVPQEAIVRKLFGGLICMPAVGLGITQSIKGRWVRPDGSHFDVAADVLQDAPSFFARPNAIPQAARELAKGTPLILGALGHATVMTAMTYTLTGDGAYRIEEVVIRDPWPDNPNRRVLTPREAMAATFLAKVYVV
jgi:hypothetical protein